MPCLTKQFTLRNTIWEDYQKLGGDVTLDKAGNANAHQKSRLIFQKLREKRAEEKKKVISWKKTPETIANENRHWRSIRDHASFPYK